jgi:hypothetical protein
MKLLLKFSVVILMLTLGNCAKKATCSDGIANQGEKYTDCGGPCAACPTCYDGIQNQGEAGIDCGGGVCEPCNTAGSKGSVTYPDSGFYGKNLLRQIPFDTIFPGEVVSLHAIVGQEANVRVRLVDLWVPSEYVPWTFAQGNTNWTQSYATNGGSYQDFYAAGPMEAEMMIIAAPVTSSNLEPFRIEYFENKSTTPGFTKIVTILK